MKTLALSLVLLSLGVASSRAWWATAPNQVIQIQQMTELQAQIGLPTGLSNAGGLASSTLNVFGSSGYVPPTVINASTTGLAALVWTDDGLYNPAPKTLPAGPVKYDPMTYKPYDAMEREVDNYHALLFREIAAQSQIQTVSTALAAAPVTSVIDGLNRINQQAMLQLISGQWTSLVRSKEMEILGRAALNNEERWKRSLIDRDVQNASMIQHQATSAASAAAAGSAFGP
ncbi:MAG: hypothetical protein PHO89_01235 [Methylacidiphilaceae bacterium]|nr:hypothetical protein [Candidatus Methylacidiphilaceae bacterium]